MEKLLEISQIISCSISLDLNQHKNYYEDAYTYYMVNTSCPPDPVGEVDFDKDIWTLRVYPRTAVGFIEGISNNLEELLAWGLEATKEY